MVWEWQHDAMHKRPNNIRYLKVLGFLSKQRFSGQPRLESFENVKRTLGLSKEAASGYKKSYILLWLKFWVRFLVEKVGF